MYHFEHTNRWVTATVGPGVLGLPTFLLSKDFFYIIVKENIINVARPQAPQCKESHNLKFNEDKPFHPPNDYIFPKTKSGDRLRSCQAHWFKQFPWLHYDEK